MTFLHGKSYFYVQNRILRVKIMRFQKKKYVNPNPDSKVIQLWIFLVCWYNHTGMVLCNHFVIDLTFNDDIHGNMFTGCCSILCVVVDSRYSSKVTTASTACIPQCFLKIQQRYSSKVTTASTACIPQCCRWEKNARVGEFRSLKCRNEQIK